MYSAKGTAITIPYSSPTRSRLAVLKLLAGWVQPCSTIINERPVPTGDAVGGTYVCTSEKPSILDWVHVPLTWPLPWPPPSISSEPPSSPKQSTLTTQELFTKYRIRLVL